MEQLLKLQNKAALIAGLVLAAFSLATVEASPLVFNGNNAAIFPGANPFNQPLMMQSVQDKQNPASAASASGISTADLIMRSVQSQISAKIKNDIFESGAASGSFDLGDGNMIDFTRTGGNIIINFTDTVHGTTTITLPDL